MKKLTKLNINPEKVMNNEELMHLRGGYDAYYTCTCSAGANPPYANPWCKAYDSAIEMYNDISKKCIGGEGDCVYALSCD